MDFWMISLKEDIREDDNELGIVFDSNLKVEYLNGKEIKDFSFYLEKPLDIQSNNQDLFLIKLHEHHNEIFSYERIKINKKSWIYDEQKCLVKVLSAKNNVEYSSGKVEDLRTH